jgi:hypothetical protein
MTTTLIAKREVVAGSPVVATAIQFDAELANVVACVAAGAVDGMQERNSSVAQLVDPDKAAGQSSRTGWNGCNNWG